MDESRCAPRRRAAGADPIGSAGHHDAFVVVAAPLPWERDATSCWPFAELGWTGPSTSGPDGRSWRPVVVVPDRPADSSAGVAGGRSVETEVVVWDRPVSDAVGVFRGRRWSVPSAAVPELIRGVVAAPFDTEQVPGFDAERATPALLICTHGRRDVCCGSLGTALVASVRAGPGPEVRRCSHTGGHRFAPTGLTFPDGLAWAHLDPELVSELRTRTAPPSDALLGRCRGAAQLPAGPAQAADRSALARFGWAWLADERRVKLLGDVPQRPEDPAVEVHVAGSLGAGVVGVVLESFVEVPACGTATGPGGPSEVEPVWRVVTEAFASVR